MGNFQVWILGDHWNPWDLMSSNKFVFGIEHFVEGDLVRAGHRSMTNLSFSAFWAASLISISSVLEEVDVNWNTHLSGWNKARFCCDVFIFSVSVIFMSWPLCSYYLLLYHKMNVLCFCYSTFHNLKLSHKCGKSPKHCVFHWSWSSMQELYFKKSFLIYN